MLDAVAGDGDPSDQDDDAQAMRGSRVASDAATADGASVVICARNAASSLAVQLAAVLAQETSFPFEVVVVDNGSTDGTDGIIALAAQLDPRVVPVYETRPGLNVARNAGIREATHRRIVLCDADDAVEPGWLQAMASALDGRVYAGGARIRGGLNTPEELELLGISAFEPSIRRSYKLGVPTPGGANCAFRREMWEAIGGFDEDITSGLDEEEFFARGHRAGWQMVEVPDALIQYYVPAGPVVAFRKGYRYGQSVEVVRTRLRRTGSMIETTATADDADISRVADRDTRTRRAAARWAAILRDSPRALTTRTGRSDWTRRLGSELGHLVGTVRARRVRTPV